MTVASGMPRSIKVLPRLLPLGASTRGPFLSSHNNLTCRGFPLSMLQLRSTCPRGAESEASADLAPAGRSASEEQSGDVQAGEAEQYARGGEQ